MLYNVIQNSFQWAFRTFVAAIQHSNQRYGVNEACLVAPNHYIEKRHMNTEFSQMHKTAASKLGVSKKNGDPALAKIKLMNSCYFQ